MSLFSSNSPSMKFPIGKSNYAKFALLKTETYGDRSALIDGISGDSLSYNKLKRNVLKLALALTRRGIKKGQVVSVIPESCVQTAVIYYGIIYIGAIVHPMNHLLKSDEMKTQLADAKPVLVIVNDTSLAEAESALDSSTDETPDIIVIGESTEHDTYTSLMAGVLDEDLSQVAPVDLDIYESAAGVFYTSGTTGVPKGVLVSHAGLIMNGLSLTACPSVALVESDHDIVLVILTIFHSMVFIVLSYIFRHGATVVIGPSLSCCTPQDLCNLTDRYKVNVIMSPPSNVQAFIKSPVSMEGSLPTLRTWMTTGASMKGHIYESVKEKFTFQLTHYYGMTELGAVTGTPKENVKQGSAGILLSDVQAKVKDLTTRSLLPANTCCCVLSPLP